ncbi:phosphoglyceromutase, partial [Pseudoloma neurophilia]
IYTMTDYGLQCKKIKILVKEEIVSETLAEIISENGLKQTHIAETEKFAHVTYFFNGGNHFQYPNEERILVNSEKVDSFRDSPLMKAKEITYRTIEKMGENVPFIVINFANPDMVGHTGDFKATKVACEFISECLEKLHHFARSNFYNLLITADHGNAEKMADVNGPITKHTTSPVPFIAIGNNIRIKPDFIGSEQEHGLTLSCVAPTVLKILGIEPSKKMTGTCLVDFLNK